MALGFAISGAVFSDPDVDVKSALNLVILYNNFAVSGIFLLFMLTFKYEPEVPPSKVATQEPPERHLSESFKELRSNRNFLIVALSYTFLVAPYNSFGALMALILTPCGCSVS